MSPRRLLLVTHGAGWGGSETAYTQLLRHFSARPEYAVYGAFPDGPQAAVWTGLCRARCRCRGRLPERPRWSGYAGSLAYGALYLPGLLRFIRRVGIEAMLVNSSVALGALLAAGALRLPAVAIVRELIDPPRLRSGLFRTIDRLADRVVAVSDTVRDDFVRRTGARDVARIYGGVDPAAFPFRERFEPVRRIGVVGALAPVKGQLDFARALARLAPLLRDRDVRCALVGPAPRSFAGYRRAVEAAIAASGLADRVALIDGRADMATVYDGLDAVVVPSRSEGQSLVILEAWASGCPVIATRCGGPPEMIEDGVNGLLVPPARPEALAAALRRLIEQPELGRALAAAGRRTVEASFRAEPSCRAIGAVVERALAGRAG